MFFVENIGGLLRYEMTFNAPCTPLMNKPFIRPASKFREIFRELQGGKMTPEQEKMRNIERHEREVTEVDFDKNVFSSVGVWFPEIYQIKSAEESLWAAQFEKVRDAAKIKTIHAEITKTRLNYYPKAQCIDEKWVFYRRLQAHLLAALDYCRKYGVENADVTSNKIANFVQDLEYCIIASLADGLATGDKSLAKFYRIICPNGIMIDA